MLLRNTNVIFLRNVNVNVFQKCYLEMLPFLQMLLRNVTQLTKCYLELIMVMMLKCYLEIMVPSSQNALVLKCCLEMQMLPKCKHSNIFKNWKEYLKCMGQPPCHLQKLASTVLFLSGEEL